VVSISSTQLTVDGTISADGDAAGDPNDGGAGAGGSINVNTGALSGTGSIHANGGDEDFASAKVSGDSFCCEGQGGGGAVALHYTSDKGLTGATSAHGGVSNDVAANPDRDFGGAGTVFLQQVASAPAAPSAPSSGSGSSGSGDGGGDNAVLAPGHQPVRESPERVAYASVASSRSVLSGLKLSTAQFTTGTGGGTVLSYRASAAGPAQFSVFSAAPGVLSGKTCVKTAPPSSGDKSCTILKGAGSFAHTDSAGANSWAFSGQVGANDLGPGSYELEASGGAKGTVQVSAPFDVLAGATVTPPSASGTSAGTLVIDGGADSDYPVPDGTPMPSGWSSPDRDLVITGGARVFGSDLTFAKITISDYGVLTTAPGTNKLTVTAGDIDVERTGRIDMSGLGYEGGNRVLPPDDSGATAPGETGSQYDNGGSHAGLGGLDGDVGQAAGSTYDNPYDPALPGGGGGPGCSTAGVTSGPSFYVAPNEIGGGVLDITAGTLENSGTIAADGQGGNGPIITFPFQFFAECGGAGAGGTIQAHAQTLTGSGSFEANGGDTCIAKLLSPYGQGPCKGSLDAGGGGGGGDVLVVAPDHSGFTGQVTARGGLLLGHPTFVNGTNPRDASGTAGSAILGT
jgi:hypothetical protein